MNIKFEVTERFNFQTQAKVLPIQTPSSMCFSIGVSSFKPAQKQLQKLFRPLACTPQFPKETGRLLCPVSVGNQNLTRWDLIPITEILFAQEQV